MISFWQIISTLIVIDITLFVGWVVGKALEYNASLSWSGGGR